MMQPARVPPEPESTLRGLYGNPPYAGLIAPFGDAGSVRKILIAPVNSVDRKTLTSEISSHYLKVRYPNPDFRKMVRVSIQEPS
jgi:hypothetical protein